MAKGYREQVGKERTGYKHIPTSLQRSKAMWHKVMSLASDQGKGSSLCLPVFKESETRNGGDGMGRGEGGSAHMLRDVSSCGGDGRLPPRHQAEERHFGFNQCRF